MQLPKNYLAMQVPNQFTIVVYVKTQTSINRQNNERKVGYSQCKQSIRGELKSLIYWDCWFGSKLSVAVFRFLTYRTLGASNFFCIEIDEYFSLWRSLHGLKIKINSVNLLLWAKINFALWKKLFVVLNNINVLL